jgi:hypothetical protein
MACAGSRSILSAIRPVRTPNKHPPPPSPEFFISADSKGVKFSVSRLESMLTGDRGSVDSKELASAICDKIV